MSLYSLILCVICLIPVLNASGQQAFGYCKKGQLFSDQLRENPEPLSQPPGLLYGVSQFTKGQIFDVGKAYDGTLTREEYHFFMGLPSVEDILEFAPGKGNRDQRIITTDPSVYKKRIKRADRNNSRGVLGFIYRDNQRETRQVAIRFKLLAEIFYPHGMRFIACPWSRQLNLPVENGQCPAFVLYSKYDLRRGRKQAPHMRHLARVDLGAVKGRDQGFFESLKSEAYEWILPFVYYRSKNGYYEAFNQGYFLRPIGYRQDLQPFRYPIIERNW